MADFTAVLRKTIDGLADNTPAMREKVYDKARATVAAKLAAISPPPPAAVADRQKQVLEDAIREVETGYSGQAVDPFAELENVFAEPKPTPPPAPAKAPPPAAQPAQSRVSPSLPAAPPVQSKAAPVNVEPKLQAPALPGSRGGDRWPPADLDPDHWEPPTGTQRDTAATFEDNADEVDERQRFEDRSERRRNFVPLIAAVVALVVILGGGYAVWLNKDDFLAMVGFGGSDKVASAPSVGDTAPVNPPPATATKSSVNTGGGAEEPQKFTQRLNSDGTEVDEGPAGGIASIGEGTSVAAATTPPATAGAEEPSVADPATPAADGTATAADAASPVATPPVAAGATETAAPAASQVAVGQKAIFYEERTNVAEGSAEPGSIVWSLVQESPGGDQPAEAAIRGEATIPGKDIQLRMTIRRNADKTLPASHIIELIFLTPENFEGGGVENILRFALKNTEEAAGSPVLGIPAKIADGFFLIALNDSKAEVQTNMTLLKSQEWIDVPLVYKSGRRALITLEKGVPGDKVFDEAIKTWETTAATAG